MILRRYGATVSQVEPYFAAVAFNEVDFTRRPGFTMERGEFHERYRRTTEREIFAEANGRVKVEVESAVLDVLAHRLAEVERALAPDEVLLVESQPGRDYPRLHERTETLVEHGRNVHHFYYYIHPPLRVGVYRRREG
jgi:hypothetical protein